MKKSRKVFKFLFITAIILMSITLVGSITYYNVITHGISLDTEKLKLQNTTQTLAVFDSSHNKIKPTNTEYINLSKLSKHTRLLRKMRYIKTIKA